MNDYPKIVVVDDKQKVEELMEKWSKVFNKKMNSENNSTIIESLQQQPITPECPINDSDV